VGSQSILRVDCQTENPIVRYSNYRFIDLPPDTCNETQQKWHKDILLHGISRSHISENYRQRLSFKNRASYI
jgi:hypothetical protein